MDGWIFRGYLYIVWLPTQHESFTKEYLEMVWEKVQKTSHSAICISARFGSGTPNCWI